MSFMHLNPTSQQQALMRTMRKNTTNVGNSRYMIWTYNNLACLIFKSFLKQETKRL